MNDRTLVIDTATAACSVALFAGDTLLDARHDVVGRGHAERLVPMIADLPDGGRATRILVDVGPGSFTGIRVGLAAARGLALGWGADVAGYSSMAVVAARHLAGRTDDVPVAVVLGGGHGEVFMQAFVSLPLRAVDALASLTPAAARERATQMDVVGDGTRWLGDGDPRSAPRGELPRAADALLLPAALRALPAVPLYGRAPDAKLPGGATPS